MSAPSVRRSGYERVLPGDLGVCTRGRGAVVENFLLKISVTTPAQPVSYCNYYILWANQLLDSPQVGRNWAHWRANPLTPTIGQPPTWLSALEAADHTDEVTK